MAEQRKIALAGWFSKLFRATPAGASAASIPSPTPQPSASVIDSFFNATADGIIMVSVVEGVITRANPAAERLLGYTTGGLIGVHFSALLPPSTASEHTNVQHRFRGMVGVSEGQAFYRRDGMEVPCDLLMTLLPDPQRPMAVLTLRDASQRESQIAKQEEAIRAFAEFQANTEATRQKDQFMSLLAHQLRTPLAIIHSAAGMVLRYYDRLPPEKRLEHLNRIQAHSRLAASFIEDMRFLSRAEADEIAVQHDSCDIVELIERVLKPYREHARQPQFTLSSPPSPVMVRLDENLFTRLVDKLISNAVVYSPPASTIDIHITHESGALSLSITDRGIGIPADFLSTAFEPHKRGSNAGETEGMGLGLTIAQTCVKLMGGQMTLKSAIGEGTTVLVRLSSP